MMHFPLVSCPTFSPFYLSLLYRVSPALYQVFLSPYRAFLALSPVLPWIFAGLLETVAVIALRVSTLGHPSSLVSPNACFFSSCSSSVPLAGGGSAGSSMDVRPNDAPCSHSSNRTGPLNKRMGPVGNNSSVLPKLCPRISAMMFPSTQRCFRLSAKECRRL
jgi:hypothetical protein